uniref:Uncharacterized protein n=1 Tax=uncultured Armatimonadetes bacterium TaxID=157466 RepID=A0A6J4K8V6_9BACT|nr:hypothetical protein AVDCRST_MAG63-5050 [uncultured Armatimonadetes bacterium]
MAQRGDHLRPQRLDAGRDGRAHVHRGRGPGGARRLRDADGGRRRALRSGPPRGFPRRVRGLPLAELFRVAGRAAHVPDRKEEEGQDDGHARADAQHLVGGRRRRRAFEFLRDQEGQEDVLGRLPFVATRFGLRFGLRRVFFLLAARFVWHEFACFLEIPEMKNSARVAEHQGVFGARLRFPCP